MTRGVDGTAASPHDSAATVTHSVSARDYREPQEHIAASSGVHGISGDVVGTTDTQTITNKTIALGSNSVSGTLAELNTAITDADVASLAGAETLTNKIMALGSNTVSGTFAQFNTAVTDTDLVSISGT